MDSKILNKIFELVMRGDKKSIARAQELISNNEIDQVTDIAVNDSTNRIDILPYLNDNGDPDIRQAIETLKQIQDVENLKMVKALLSMQIKDLKYNSRKKQAL